MTLLAEARGMSELLAELEAIRTLADRLTDEVVRLRRHVDRAEQRMRIITRLTYACRVDDDEGGD